MRNARIADHDETDRAIVAIGTDYPPVHVLPAHQHRRAQLLYGVTGVMQVLTPVGQWVVPPQQAVWLPSGMVHEVRMQGVSTRSLYVAPEAVVAPWFQHCRVLAVSPLLRQLLVEAVDLPRLYDEAGRDGALMALLLLELAQMPTLPLHLPLPATQGLLLRWCQAFAQAPSVAVGPEQAAAALHMSVRTLGRLFQAELGLSFAHWRERACVVAALARLAEGVAVTRIAMDLGYGSSAAFTTMFKRVVGQVPSAWRG